MWIYFTCKCFRFKKYLWSKDSLLFYHGLCQTDVNMISLVMAMGIILLRQVFGFFYGDPYLTPLYPRTTSPKRIPRACGFGHNELQLMNSTKEKTNTFQCLTLMFNTQSQQFLFINAASAVIGSQDIKCHILFYYRCHNRILRQGALEKAASSQPWTLGV